MNGIILYTLAYIGAICVLSLAAICIDIIIARILFKVNRNRNIRLLRLDGKEFKGSRRGNREE